MRKTLEAIALLALLVTWGFTCVALVGPSRLSGIIAIHFDAAGRPNGWGEASTLWFLPALAVVIYVTLSVVARMPAVFSLPTPITEESRIRLQFQARSMILWLKAEIICFFGWIQFEIIRSAQQLHLTLSPAFVQVYLAAIFVTVAWRLGCMWQAVRTRHAIVERPNP